MSNPFGEYENETEVIDMDAMFEGDDSVWEERPKTLLPPGKYQLQLINFEAQSNADTGSQGFYFYFKPYAYENGDPVPAFAVEKMKLRRYFYVGKKENGKLVANGFTNVFTQFLQSIGIVDRKFSLAKVENTLVWATLELGPKKPTTRPDAETGVVPEFDEDDPKTYVQFLQIKDDAPIYGVRDENNQVQKAY